MWNVAYVRRKGTTNIKANGTRKDGARRGRREEEYLKAEEGGETEESFEGLRQRKSEGEVISNAAMCENVPSSRVGDSNWQGSTKRLYIM